MWVYFTRKYLILCHDVSLHNPQAVPVSKQLKKLDTPNMKKKQVTQFAKNQVLQVCKFSSPWWHINRKTVNKLALALLSKGTLQEKALLCWVRRNCLPNVMSTLLKHCSHVISWFHTAIISNLTFLHMNWKVMKPATHSCSTPHVRNFLSLNKFFFFSLFAWRLAHSGLSMWISRSDGNLLRRNSKLKIKFCNSSRQNRILIMRLS